MKPKKTNNLLLAGTFIICLIAFSCTSPVSLSGQTARTTRDLPAFASVSLAISADVLISQGDRQQVEIEADENVIDIIETNVNGDDLVIKTEDFFWRNMGQVRIYITMPDIKALQVSGSGDITTQTPVNTDDIRLNISGSGSIVIEDLKSGDVNATITGSGDVRITGNASANNLKAVITGSGDFRAEDLAFENAVVNITGSGTARIRVLNELKTNITGSGDVYYRGDPLIDARSTGSGRTRSMLMVTASGTAVILE
ncbi:MAG: DUF2807 domain-containing protein [Bacteroidales bacterium]|nr:DUF2807 domain-containing protein [Bacteroidales bacterium]